MRVLLSLSRRTKAKAAHFLVRVNFDEEAVLIILHSGLLSCFQMTESKIKNIETSYEMNF